MYVCPTEGRPSFLLFFFSSFFVLLSFVVSFFVFSSANALFARVLARIMRGHGHRCAPAHVRGYGHGRTCALCVAAPRRVFRASARLRICTTRAVARPCNCTRVFITRLRLGAIRAWARYRASARKTPVAACAASRTYADFRACVSVSSDQGRLAHCFLGETNCHNDNNLSHK